MGAQVNLEKLNINTSIAGLNATKEEINSLKKNLSKYGKINYFEFKSKGIVLVIYKEIHGINGINKRYNNAKSIINNEEYYNMSTIEGGRGNMNRTGGKKLNINLIKQKSFGAEAAEYVLGKKIKTVFVDISQENLKNLIKKAKIKAKKAYNKKKVYIEILNSEYRNSNIMKNIVSDVNKYKNPSGGKGFIATSFGGLHASKLKYYTKKAGFKGVIIVEPNSKISK